jgi:hypothetical protein
VIEDIIYGEIKGMSTHQKSHAAMKLLMGKECECLAEHSHLVRVGEMLAIPRFVSRILADSAAIEWKCPSRVGTDLPQDGEETLLQI